MSAPVDAARLHRLRPFVRPGARGKRRGRVRALPAAPRAFVDRLARAPRPPDTTSRGQQLPPRAILFQPPPLGATTGGDREEWVDRRKAPMRARAIGAY